MILSRFSPVFTRWTIFAVLVVAGATGLSSRAAASPITTLLPTTTVKDRDVASDDAMSATYERWIIQHQPRHQPLHSARQSPLFPDAMRAEQERQKRLEQEDARMALSYSQWPILKAPVSASAPENRYDDALLGDWWGLKPRLDQYGVVLSLNYFGMVVGNVAGGMRKGADYAGQTSIGMDVDWGVLTPLKGFSTHILLLNRSGRPVGRDYVGDSIFNENQIYGAGGNVIAHLSYAYAEQKLWGGKLNLLAGRLGAAMLFNASPIYCDFFSFGLCPTPRGISGGSEGGFVMPPQNNWAFYASLNLAHGLYLHAGINAVGGTLGGTSGFDWSNHGVTGVSLPFELGWDSHWGKDRKPFHLWAGFYGSTAQAPDLALNRQGDLLALAGGQALDHRGYFATWAGGDVMILRQNASPNGGLVFFFNYNHSDDRISIYRDMGIVGFQDRGFWKKRPKDRIGLLFICSEQSSWLRNRLRAANLPGAQTYTDILEAQYGAHIAPGTILTSDIQYVIRPGAAGTYRNATVLGASLQVGF